MKYLLVKIFDKGMAWGCSLADSQILSQMFCKFEKIIITTIKTFYTVTIISQTFDLQPTENCLRLPNCMPMSCQSLTDSPMEGGILLRAHTKAIVS